MLRPLSTYLLLIMTCSFFMMGMNELHLDNFVKSKSAEITNDNSASKKHCSYITAKSLPFAATKTSCIDNFGLENEVEVETDVLPIAEFTPSYFNLTNFRSHFLNVYSTYFFTVIKIEFLDIFSPPPNC